MGLFDQTQDTKDKKKKLASNELNQGGAGGQGAATGDASGFGSALRTARDYSLKVIGVDPGVQDQSIGTTLKNTVNNIADQGIGGAFIEGGKKSISSMRDQFANYEGALAKGAKSIFAGRGSSENSQPSVPIAPTSLASNITSQQAPENMIPVSNKDITSDFSTFNRSDGRDTLQGPGYSISSATGSFRNGRPIDQSRLDKLDQEIAYNKDPNVKAKLAEQAKIVDERMLRAKVMDSLDRQGNASSVYNINPETQQVENKADPEALYKKAALASNIAKDKTDAAIEGAKFEADTISKAHKIFNDAETAGTRMTPAIRKSVFDQLKLGLSDSTLPSILGDKYEEYAALPVADKKAYLQKENLI